jgi:AcrR family transcriptional regulator
MSTVTAPRVRRRRDEPAEMSGGPRDAILDAAERLFADRGFDGVSVRDVAAEAGIRPGLATYYFPMKQTLFEAVIARRTDVLNERRQQALAALTSRGTWDVEDVLVAFVEPYLSLSLDGEAGWRTYGRLIAQLAQGNRYLPFVEKYLNDTAERFRDALERALPGTPPETVARGFVFSIQLMVDTFTQNNRIEALSRGVHKGADLPSATADLIPFLAGGIRALALARATDGDTRAR